MSGFLGGPSLHQLASGSRDQLAVAAREYDESERGPLPLNAFLAANFDQPPPEAGALRGVPVAVKDCIATSDFPTTCSSRVLEGYRSPFEATAVRRLREGGAIIVGKTNMDEFAMGASTELSAFGATRNPRDRRFVPGGSSGGSAAAVAAGITPVALGSETRWSIRQPAAYCGVVGFVPTYSRISRYGLIGFAPSIDRIGVFGRSVADTSAVYDIIAGFDPRDATSSRHAVEPAFQGGRVQNWSRNARPPANADDADAVDAGLRGLRIGVPVEFLDTVTPSVRHAFVDALTVLRGVGAEIVDIRLPNTSLAIAAYQAITSVEASSSLARFDGSRFGRRPDGTDADAAYAATRAEFGPEVKRRMIFGAELLSGSAGQVLRRAATARRRVADDYGAAFQTVDLLFAPSAPEPAFAIGARVADPHPPHLDEILTVGSSLVGLPAVSIPIGAEDTRPLGGQLIGRPFDERRLLRAAASLERAIGWSGKALGTATRERAPKETQHR